MFSLGLTRTRTETSIPPPVAAPRIALVHDNKQADAAIRPQRFSDFIGQARVKENLMVAVQAARARGETLDHILLTGGAGLGKTTLAHILANEMGSRAQVTSAPMLKNKNDLVGILLSLKDRDVFFLDEIHSLDIALAEMLYTAIEDFRLDLVIDGRIVALPLKRFTFAGATTKPASISAPLRDRFGIVLQLDPYTPEDLARIIIRSAGILNVRIDGTGALEIARSSRGTPRVANHLLRRVRDFADVRGNSYITSTVAHDALTRLGIDDLGCDAADRQLLRILVAGNGPVGLRAMAATLNEQPDTIEEVREPHLLQVGLVQRTARGRVATTLARKHLSKGEIQ